MDFVSNYVELLIQNTKSSSTSIISKKLKSFISDMSSINFVDFLMNKSVNKEEKHKFIKYVCEKYKIDDFVYVIYAIIDYDRAEYLFEIFQNYLLAVSKIQEHVSIAIFSAFEISKPCIDDIVELVSKQINKKVKYNFYIDKSLIGGFVVKGDNFIIDKSIRNCLDDAINKVKEDM
ncbi:MAG: ATP synthase F1 subunit delta [Mycoplasmataceae bacterium]|jgi:F-type H+-transporting ATPase subunit delta|nr:ATP synthase F1 subunit delta [Mycoplasmataceae bacterium]